MGKNYYEYRGVDNAVYARVLVDAAEEIRFDQVKPFVGLSQVGKQVESSNEAHYYDNIPAVIVSSTGADTINLNTAGIPFDVLAEITGQYYDAETGMLVEQERNPAYFALGYVTQKTDGTEVLVWRLKGTFTVPEQTSNTQDNGTEANGQTLTYTGINTTHKFSANGNKSAKAVNVDTSVNRTVTRESFFSSVRTPDTVGGTVNVTGVGVVPAALTIHVGSTSSLQAVVIPQNATTKTVTWSSSAEGVATVSASGIVTAVAAGSATITATTADGSYTDTCAVTVTES